MSGGKRLLEYLDAMENASWGCISRYEESIGQTDAWLSGHYQGMLSDLIRVFGIPTVRSACVIMDATDNQTERMGE